MKILKLIGIFFAIIAVILAVTFGGTFVDKTMPSIPPMSYNNAGDRLNKRISEEWKKCSKWNIMLYDSFAQEIEQSKASNLITPPHASSLSKQNALDAAERLCELTYAELKKSNCSYDVIKTYITVHIPSLVKRDNSIELLSDIEILKKCWAVYYNISVFGWHDYRESVVFSALYLTWETFEGLYNDQNPQTVAANFRKDDTYKKYLNNISSLKNSLSSEAIKEKLYNNRYYYYKEVTSQLNSYTSNASLNDDNQTRLTRAYSNLYEDYIEDDSNYEQLYNMAAIAKRNFESDLKSKIALKERIESEKKKLNSKKIEVDKKKAEVSEYKSALSKLKADYYKQKRKRKKEDIKKSIDSHEIVINTYSSIVSQLTTEYNEINSNINSYQAQYNKLR